MNLFDNAKAQRQVKTSGNEEERNRRIELENGGTRGRETSHDIFAVNGPLGEETPSLSKYRDKKQFRNNSIQSIESSGGFHRMENANSAETLSPVLKSVLSDPSPNKKKIEAYINAVYEQATKERAIKEKNNRKNLSAENNFTYFNDSKNRFREWIKDGSRIESVVNDPRNPIVKLTKLKSGRGFKKTSNRKDNRGFLELEECDRLTNFSESENPEGGMRNRSRGAVRLENTFDYTPLFLAIQSSRIPEESQFSRQTQRNSFSNVSPDKGSLATTIEFFTSKIPLRNNTNENVNRDIMPSTIKSNSSEGDMTALLSKIVISGAHRSMESGKRQYGFRTLENISDNVNSLRNALAEKRNLSAAAFQNGNARSEAMEVENANVSTRISTLVPAFTRLRNLSSSSTIGISRLEKLSAPTVRPGDKSSTEIRGSRRRSSLPANEVQGSSDEFSNLYEGRESQRIYSSLQQKTPKDVNLKNGYKFWKPSRRKLRKWKGTEKFREDKEVGGDPKQGFGKSLSTRELIWEKRGSPNFKCDTSPNESSIEKCFQRRPRRHLRIENSNSAKSKNLPKDEDSHRKMQAIVDHYARPEIVYYKRKMSQNRGNGSPKKQVILESGHSYKKVRSEESDNPFFFNKESGKESKVDKRIKDKFARISNVLKEDSAEVRIIQETSKNLKAVTESKVTRADIPEIQDKLKNDLFSRKSDKPEFATRKATPEYPAGLIDTRQRVMNENFFAITKPMTTNNEITTISTITLKDDFDYKESASLQSREKLSDTIIGPFLSSPITRKLSHNVSKQANLDESTSPIYTNTMTEVFVSKLSSQIPRGRNVNGYFVVANGSLSTLSSNCTNSKETTMYSEALNNRSESEQDEIENARFLELNKDSSRMIAGNFTGPRGPPIGTDLLLRGSGSIAEPTEASSSNEGEEGSCYIRDPLRKNSVDIPESEDSTARSQRSRKKDEIAELVSRIVRQYVAYTPVMPGMPTFDEITEAETLPPEEETTTVTTTLATTTRITDATFRPSKTLRPLEMTALSREMHDEIALDETTFVDETEATTSQERIISRWKFRTGKSDTSFTSEGKVDRVSSEIGKSEKRQKIFNRIIANAKMMDGERKIEDHPWYRTTEMQQIIAGNRSKPAQKTESRGKKQRYKSKSDYFPNASSTTASSSIATDDVILETRSKRSDFIRKSNDRDFSIFYDYEEEDNEGRAQNGRMALSKNGKSSDMTTESSELRSRIEKGLAGKLNYSTKSSRQSCESRDQTQKHNAAPRDIAARDMKLEANNRDERYLEEKERNSTKDDLKNVALLKLRRVKDDAVGRFDEGVISQSRQAISASLEIPFPAKIPTSRKDLSGSLNKRPKIDRRTEKRGFGRAVAKIVGARKIVSNPLENARTDADDLSNRGAEPRRESTTNGILTGRAKSSGDQDKNRQTDTVIRDAKLMIADDKGETRDVVAAKSARYKKTPVYGAKQWKRKDARKINENHAKNPRVHRAFREEYFRRPPGEVYDSIRKTIGKILKEKSSSVSDDRNIAGRHADRSLSDHRYRSNRRLLSSRSSYIKDVEDEYYEDDGSETEGENDSVSDNEPIARRDDLSDLENQPILREDRDSRKLLPKTDRLADENADAARTVMPEETEEAEERTVAACDATVVSDVQGVSEEAVSRFVFYIRY